MRDKLTDRFSASAPPGLHWGNADRRAPKGFLLRVTPAGARAGCLNYRVKDTGRERRLTIGDTSTWPIAMAIKRAAELRRMASRSWQAAAARAVTRHGQDKTAR
jgi:hypothetical protein